MRALIWLLAGVAAWVGPAAATAATVADVVDPVEPTEAVQVWSGLRAPVRVVEDRFGIPHVYATDEWDLFFTVGYLHARDRLFQMAVSRRRAEGTLAELVGEAALGEDVQMRTLGLSRAAAASLARLSEGARADLAAYAAGVNAFIDEAVRSGNLPEAYGALELSRVRPWRPVDSISVLKLVGFSLSFGLDAQYGAVAQAYMERLGAEEGLAAFLELWRSAPSDPAATVPDAVGYAPRVTDAGLPAAGPSGEAAAAGHLLVEWWRSLAELPAAEGARQLPLGALGSNWFVIGPSLAGGGYPILANDPHLPITDPPVWYPQHLVARGPQESEPSIDVLGVALPGVPWVILGHTRFVAWGATTHPADQTDTFVEQLVERDGRLYTQYEGRLEAVEVLPQRFLVNRPDNGRMDDLVAAPADRVPQAVLVVPRHGPIVRMDESTGQALTVQWTGAYATHDGESFHRWNRARGLHDFVDGLRYMDAASQNWAYADVEGNIAYFAGAELPLRRDLDRGFVDGGLAWAPFLLRDGTGTLQHDWIPWPSDEPLPEGQGLPFEVLPPSEMPHVVNPVSGFIVSANNDPIGVTLDGDPFDDRRSNGGIYYLAPSYGIGFRAGRITELIRDRARRAGRLSVTDAMAIQSDVVQLSARRLVPWILAAWERAQRADAPEPLARLVTPEMREAMGYLASWDFSTPTGLPDGWDASDTVAPGEHLVAREPDQAEVEASVAATLFNVMVGRLIQHTVDAAIAPLGPDLPRPDGSTALRVVLHHLEHFDRTGGVGAAGLALFDAPGLELSPADERDLILLVSLEDALRLLRGPLASAFGGVRTLRDLRWGMLHRLVRLDPIGRPVEEQASAEAATRIRPPGTPVDGGFEVVDASGYDPRASSAAGFRFTSGPSVRLIVQMRPGAVTTYMAWPGGPVPPAVPPDPAAPPAPRDV
ncbi:MAG: penicillin acylase family protein, partial [Firmicutes bacterium]|nr:penicillin acylase family protein [Bacillota bacterium]